jgi:hypothetical protein
MFYTVAQLRQLVKDRIDSNARSARLARASQAGRRVGDAR